MTAKEILYEIKNQHNIGTAWQLTEHIIIEAMEKYAQQQVKNCAIPLVSNPVVCKIGQRPDCCYYRDITNDCKGCRENTNNCC